MVNLESASVLMTTFLPIGDMILQ